MKENVDGGSSFGFKYKIEIPKFLKKQIDVFIMYDLKHENMA